MALPYLVTMANNGTCIPSYFHGLLLHSTVPLYKLP